MNRGGRVSAGRENNIAAAARAALRDSGIDSGRVVGLAVACRAEVADVELRGFELR
jgi:hypothetical protein